MGKRESKEGEKKAETEGGRSREEGEGGKEERETGEERRKEGGRLGHTPSFPADQLRKEQP